MKLQEKKIYQDPWIFLFLLVVGVVVVGEKNKALEKVVYSHLFFIRTNHIRT